MNLRRINEILTETIYAIGSGGLTPIQTGKIMIQPNVVYHMGASTSPQHIFVTKVSGTRITYREYPFYGQRDSVIDRRIGEDLILRGVMTFLKSGYTKYPGGQKTVKKYNALMAGKKVKPENLKDYDQFDVVIGPGDGYVGKDMWREAENYGNLGGQYITGKKDGFASGKGKNESVYTIYGIKRSSLKKLEKDKRFVVIEKKPSAKRHS